MTPSSQEVLTEALAGLRVTGSTLRAELEKAQAVVDEKRNELSEIERSIADLEEDLGCGPSAGAATGN
jgi:chromosome segregation ATPase